MSATGVLNRATCRLIPIHEPGSVGVPHDNGLKVDLVGYIYDTSMHRDRALKSWPGDLPDGHHILQPYSIADPYLYGLAKMAQQTGFRH